MTISWFTTHAARSMRSQSRQRSTLPTPPHIVSHIHITKSNQVNPPTPSLVSEVVNRVGLSQDRHSWYVYSRSMAEGSATHAQIGMFKVESCKVDTRRIEDAREVGRVAEIGTLSSCADSEAVGNTQISRTVIICDRTCYTRESS
jgi:hypothetical protein